MCSVAPAHLWMKRLVMPTPASYQVRDTHKTVYHISSSSLQLVGVHIRECQCTKCVSSPAAQPKARLWTDTTELLQYWLSNEYITMFIPLCLSFHHVIFHHSYYCLSKCQTYQQISAYDDWDTARRVKQVYSAWPDITASQLHTPAATPS